MPPLATRAPHPGLKLPPGYCAFNGQRALRGSLHAAFKFSPRAYRPRHAAFSGATKAIIAGNPFPRRHAPDTRKGLRAGYRRALKCGCYDRLATVRRMAFGESAPFTRAS